MKSSRNLSLAETAIIAILSIVIQGCAEPEEKLCQNSTGFIVGSSSYPIPSTDKVAQSFQLSKDATLTELISRLSAPGATSVTITLYEVGSEPEAGTLVATSTLSSGLSTSTIENHYFPVSEVSLKANTEYFLVVQGSGGGIEVERSSSGSVDGDFWEYAGGTWTKHAGDDMSYNIYFLEACE